MEIGVVEVPATVQEVLPAGAKAGVRAALETAKAGTSTNWLWNPEAVWVTVCGTSALAANTAPMVMPTMAMTVPMNHNRADRRVTSRCDFRMAHFETR